MKCILKTHRYLRSLSGEASSPGFLNADAECKLPCLLVLQQLCISISVLEGEFNSESF